MFRGRGDALRMGSSLSRGLSELLYLRVHRTFTDFVRLEPRFSCPVS